jgi:phosphoribosylanthranilate isomerase
MSILVKICGINSADAADAAARAGADIAGLMFRPGSPRELRPEQASALGSRLRGKVRLAVVFSDPTDLALDVAVAAVRPDFIQLHGAESPDRVVAIRERFRVDIIKAISLADRADLAIVSKYEACADMLMFDAKAPAGASREGGHGAAFDWQILRGRKFARPWLLAGGLNPDNVARAIRTSEAPGVDVSSGVETTPGQKSVELISRFVAAARNAEFAKETGA